MTKSNDYDMGKLPPQAIDLEEAVLGALLIDKNAILSVLDILIPESFYKESHQIIFKSIVDLSTRMEAIDILTVTQELRKNSNLEEVGGPFYIAQLTNKIASASHVEFHSRIIAQKYVARELIRISNEINTMAYDDSAEVVDILEKLDTQLAKLTKGIFKSEPRRISETINETIKEIEQRSKYENKFSGLPSGLISLDRITGGWQKSDLVILAARPSMGKTAIALKFAKSAAIYQKKVCIFSCEMSVNQLNNRIISSETGISPTNLRLGKINPLQWEEIEKGVTRIIDYDIFVDDTSNISILELKSKAAKLKRKYDIDLVIVDYLQLMRGDQSHNREREISSIAMGLKAIAKDLSIPVIALSQLNREVEKRGDKKPQLSDLRESGAIEQDADMVIFIHRPAYYGIENYDGHETYGMGVLNVAKHRNGMVGEIFFRHNESLTDISDFDEF